MTSNRSRSSSAIKRTSRGPSSTSRAGAKKATKGTTGASPEAPSDRYRALVAVEASASKAEEAQRFHEAAQAHAKAVKIAGALARPALFALLL